MSDATSVPGLRSKAPVFVLGSPRSGTTYLYHVLLSAGNFAIYRAESEVLAVVDAPSSRRVLGTLSEAHALRRYLSELELQRREYAGVP